MTVTVMMRVMMRIMQVGRICLTSFTPTPALSSSMVVFGLQDPETMESNSRLV